MAILTTAGGAPFTQGQVALTFGAVTWLWAHFSWDDAERQSGILKLKGVTEGVLDPSGSEAAYQQHAKSQKYPLLGGRRAESFLISESLGLNPCFSS